MSQHSIPTDGIETSVCGFPSQPFPGVLDSPACTLYISCTLVTVNKPLTFNSEKPASAPESVPSALTVTCEKFGKQCYSIRSSAWTIYFSNSPFSDKNNKGKFTFFSCSVASLKWLWLDPNSFVLPTSNIWGEKWAFTWSGLCTLKVQYSLSLALICFPSAAEKNIRFFTW